MDKTAYIAFGSNLGDREKNIRGAYEALSLVPGVRCEALSDLYETEPWGVTEQPMFLNACARVSTDRPPEMLLGSLLGIEAAFGRVRGVKNGPRILDLDLLLYEGETRDTPALTLPHPRMLERAFVLEPLLDVSPGGFALGLDVKAALAALSETDSAS